MTTQIKLFDIIWTNKLTDTLWIPRYSPNTCHITDSTGPVGRCSAVMSTHSKENTKDNILFAIDTE